MNDIKNYVYRDYNWLYSNMVQLLDGKVVAQSIRDRLKGEIKLLPYIPHLCVIQLGKDDEGSNLYVKFKKKAAEEIGMKSSTY